MTNQTIIELLARRKGWQFIQCGENSSTPGMWRVKPPNSNEIVVTRFETREGAIEAYAPSYLSSLDALQPVLATLSEEEWDRLACDLEELRNKRPTEERLRLYKVEHVLKMPAKDLALCIAKAIEKKDQ